MPLFFLAETPAGYALLKAKDKKLLKREDLCDETKTAEGTCNLLKLKHFQKWESATMALNETAALIDGKLTDSLKGLLNTIKDEKKASLAVADAKLAKAINKEFDITPVADSSTTDMFRAIRQHMTSLIPGLQPDEIDTMALGLSHSLSRHKLKFSPDKVDTMIMQAIALLDEIDKDLNTYAMRVKEWYGWHFPEMAKIINDNLAYARVIIQMGSRSKAAVTDLSEILPEEVEKTIKSAAEVSMGTELTDEDLETIKTLAAEVVEMTDYRQQLSSYLSARMHALAPNLTALVGELVGARLVSHAGSLLNLSKSPASTIQILGAEKALFRALKTKHDTPKYGLIFHASLIGQATGRNKGKIARMLAAKAALGLRVDALSDWGIAGENKLPEPTEDEKAAVGNLHRLAIERRLASLENKPITSKKIVAPPSQKQPGKFEVIEAQKYNSEADGLAGDQPATKELLEAAIQADVAGGDKAKAKMTDVVAEESTAEESDQSMEDASPRVDGGKSTEDPGKDAKWQRKQEKKRLRAEKEKRKAEKEEKRAQKQAKKAKKAAAEKAKSEATKEEPKEATDKPGKKDKKRKRESAEDGEKKKKKSKA